MALGLDASICVNEFVTAMKKRLSDHGHDPNNVELPEVRPNFEALGKAVFLILTTDANVVSDNASDASFWQWVDGVSATLKDLAIWQTAVATAAASWGAATADQGMKTALGGSVQHAAPAAAPTESRCAVR